MRRRAASTTSQIYNDMNDQRLLYKQNSFLTLYDLKTCNVIFNNYPIEDYAEAVLFDNNRTLVYRGCLLYTSDAADD